MRDLREGLEKLAQEFDGDGWFKARDVAKKIRALLAAGTEGPGLRVAAENVVKAWFDGRPRSEPVRDPKRLDAAMDALEEALASRPVEGEKK